MTTGVYQITCVPTGKRYIGSSCDIEKRWRDHRSELSHNKHHNVHLQRAWNKYGEQVFEFGILEKCESNREKIQEQNYLDDLQPEFNIALDACGFSKGHRHTLETKDKMRAHWTSERRAKSSAVNKQRLNNPEYRAKLSEIAKQRFADPKERAKLSAALKGKKLTPETRAKLSAAHKGKTLTPEHRAKISAAGKGKSGPNKGKKPTPGHRAKLSVAQKRRWARYRAEKEAKV